MSPDQQLLSPLPDSWTPAKSKTPGLETEADAWTPYQPRDESDDGGDRASLLDQDDPDSVSQGSFSE